MLLRIFLLAPASACLALAGCSGGTSQSSPQPQFFAEENPAYISEWGVFDVSAGQLKLADRVTPYDLNAALFTDYALKLRTIWIPEGAGAGAYREGDYPNFPIGTVISKTFYYPKGEGETQVLKVADSYGSTNTILDSLDQVRLVETRLLVHREEGWDAISYVWNKDQTDARLTKIGDVQKLVLVDEDTSTAFTYVVPDINQCAGCHAPNNTTRELAPLGVRPRHLNKSYSYDSEDLNQLEHLQNLNYLSGAEEIGLIKANADWRDEGVSLQDRARSYLDINCSHCHNPVGPADTSGLDLTVQALSGPALGVCKLPIAAGAGTGGRAFSIVPGQPDESILLHRIETIDPGAMMPELGRALQHREGAALLRDWIAEMEGDCAL